MRTPPCRHSRQLNSIFNDVVEFTIREILGLRREQIRYSWVKAPPHLRPPSSVDAVTNGASRHEMFASLRQGLRFDHQWILLVAFTTGNREIPHPPSHYV